MDRQDTPRLIEHAFPLKQTSLDSVHEKNVRHGHISTLHIWPARRPLAACRAALIATLLPDPGAQPKPEGMSDEHWQQEVIRRRQELCERIGGKVVKKQEKKKMPNGQIVERDKESTEGGILHWGREAENAKELEWFRQEIRKAYGGRAPKVLDPFAGGGAIPLEAMRLGCETTAVDINPVAWFILKCTLEYPQKLAGKTWPLPGFILGNDPFMEAFYKAHPHLVGRTKKTKKQLEKEALAPNMFDRPDSGRAPKADLAWQVRAWGQWVLDRARRELAAFYPVYADFEPVDQRVPKPFEPQSMRLVPLKEDGTPDIEALNGEFGKEYLAELRNPRWVAKPTVAYLWARTVQCKNCRASLPLLKTRWLCKKDKKRVLLTMEVVEEVVEQVGQASLPGHDREGQAQRPVPPEVDKESTPPKGKEFTPPKGKEPTPSKGKEPTPSKGKEPTPSKGKESTPSKGKESTPSKGKESTPSKGKESTPSKGKESTPSKGKESTPSKGKDILYSYRRKLPHWRIEGATYFLTWRLHKRQQPLEPAERQLVVEALSHFDGTRYTLYAYVVMDDHVHVLVEPLAGWELSSISHSWKSFTAHQLQRQYGRQGAVWQDESFDRIVRDEEALLAEARYIQNNPLKRWPEIQDYPWMGFPQWDNEGDRVGESGEAYGTAEAGEIRRVGVSGRAGVSACPRVVFGVQADVPAQGGNTAQRREHDKRIGAGTMSRSGAKCPCCGTIMTMEDIRLEGQAGRLGAVNTAVVVDGQKGKEYRLPTGHEGEVGEVTEEELQRVFGEIPFGVPDEPLPSKEALGFRVPLYGFDQWRKIFTSRQFLALGTFVKWTRAAREEMARQSFSAEWIEASIAYLASMSDRLANQLSSVSRWNQGGEKIEGTFARFALPILWDFAECNPLGETSGGYSSAFEWVTLAADHLTKATANCPKPNVVNQSAIGISANSIDCIVTDPPYYDAIPYSDLMDFFYVWLRRSLSGLSQDIDIAFRDVLAPKWNSADNDGELIDDASRHGGDRTKSKAVYEDGMARVFQSCHKTLTPDGQLVVVFAHKHPDAWETLVSAIIRAGFVVDGSWPIQTERAARARSLTSAALASSIWLVCKKRSPTARPGWDTQVLEEMHQNIREQLREFWDAGIRGPDFVWAATGPALEAYSKHPVVKKANEPGPLTVTEFLTQVRRMVVDFVVGRVLSGEEAGGVEASEADRLDEPTAYYLLHRHDFGLDEAPAGACILYAVSCGLSDRELAGSWDLIGFAKGKSSDGDEEEGEEDADAEVEVEEDSGSKIKLKTWAQRKGRSLGYEAPGGRPVPLIDRVHCLMHLWKAGDLHQVDEYLDGNGLRRQELFKRLLQSLIELSPRGSEERALLESLSNHVQGRGAVKDQELRMALEDVT